MSKPIANQHFAYPYEEFADHVRAMRTVREWEYTCRFGHLGKEQTSRANNARALEYFSDVYEDSKEAVYKAERFLCIYDYIARHEGLFCRNGFIDKTSKDVVLVEPALLRSVHLVFTATVSPDRVAPEKVLVLANILKEIGCD